MQFSTQIGEHSPRDQPPSKTQLPKNTITSEETEKSDKPHHGLALLDYWWGLDILALGLSFGILIAIIVNLSVYDGREQPDWRWMSLNSLLAWLSTAGKYLIAFPLSSCLSQLKWVWFAQQKRPL